MMIFSIFCATHALSAANSRSDAISVIFKGLSYKAKETAGYVKDRTVNQYNEYKNYFDKRSKLNNINGKSSVAESNWVLALGTVCVGFGLVMLSRKILSMFPNFIVDALCVYVLFLLVNCSEYGMLVKQIGEVISF